MRDPTAGQQVLHEAPPKNPATATAAAERVRAARAAHAVLDGRHRRVGQAALAESILQLSHRRR